jgi:hypothetical protein
LGIDRAAIFFQKSARIGPEGISFVILIFLQVFLPEFILADPQASGKTIDIPALQNRSGDPAAVCALPAIDVGSDFPIVLVDERVDFPNGKIRTLQEGTEIPIGVLHAPRQFLNSFGIRLKFR